MATNYLPSSGWYSTSNEYIFYRFKIDDSISNNKRSVTITLQAYKSETSTSDTTTNGSFYFTVNGTKYTLTIPDSTNFKCDGVTRNYGSISPTVGIETNTLTVNGYFSVSRFSSSEQGGSITLTASSFTNTIHHYVRGFRNGEGTNADKTLYGLGSTNFKKTYNDKFKLSSSDATTIPNGFYLVNTYGTASFSSDGSWQNYTLGTEHTQPAKDVSIQFDYTPYYYNITYDLDGGINNTSNPATYNVLYGVSLKEPTKPYHTFKGWRIKTEAKDITIAAVNGNYNYVRILNNIQPGVTYDIGIDSAVLKSGSATQFTIKIYDFTSTSVLATSRYNNLGGSVNLTLKCPSSADASHDIAIIMYAGVVGSTANNSVTYSNVQVDYYSPLPIYDIDFSNTNFVKNAAINSSTGEYVESTNYTATPDLIPIQGGITLYSNMTVCGIYTYDANGNFIKRESSYTKIHPISSNAKYMRVEIALNTNTYEEYATNFKLDNVMGINKCLDATFSSSSDLYAKLTARMTGNVTVKAIWEPYKYIITFNGNGGTTTIDSLEVAYETSQNNDVSQYIPQRQAYEFLGWYSSPTGGVQVYDENGLCTNDGTYWLNDVYVYTEDYTLYAQWKTLNIAYGRPNEVWNLYYVYKKANGNWYPSIMYVRPNNEYIR